MAVAAASLACKSTTEAARVVSVAPGVLLLLLRYAPGPGPLTLQLGDRVVGPPSCAVMLADGEGTCLAFLAAPGGRLPDGAVGALLDGHGTAHRFRLRAAEPAEALARDLGPEEQLRLLRCLSGTAAQLFRREGDAFFAALLHGLALRLADARPMALLTDARQDWVLAGGEVLPRGAWHLLSRRRLRRIVGTARDSLLLDGPVEADALLLPPPPALPRPLRPVVRAPALRSLLRTALRPGAGGVARRALDAVTARAATEPGCAALLRTAQLYAPAAPRQAQALHEPLGLGLDLALHDHGCGLFAKGWLRDPLRLVGSLALHGAFGEVRLDPAALPRVERPDIAARFARAPHGPADVAAGFLLHLPRVPGAADAAQWRLRARLLSGETVEAVAPPGLLPAAVARDLVLRAAGPASLSPALLDEVIGPAARCLQRAAIVPPGEAERIAMGRASVRPAVSIVVPLYRNLRFLRFQLNGFARDATLRGAEFIYVLDSPEQKAEVEHLLRGLSLLHDLPLTLIVQPANLGFASACNAGAAAARGRDLLFLNSDVVVSAPGWLAPLRAALRRDVVAAGPKLLFDCGSIQHAGLFFRRGPDGTWLNDHYHKGLPRDWPAAGLARRVPGVTGAALLVRRAAFEAVGGFCTDYVIGDFEDSDLCLKLRAAGHEIAYVPSAELFHFERQSIATHAGHARSAAGWLNRRLHHHRWTDSMEALMRRFPAV